jgi:hypothetical protein
MHSIAARPLLCRRKFTIWIYRQNVAVQRGRAIDLPLQIGRLAASVATDGYPPFWAVPTSRDSAATIIPRPTMATGSRIKGKPPVEYMPIQDKTTIGKTARQSQGVSNADATSRIGQASSIPVSDADQMSNHGGNDARMRLKRHGSRNAWISSGLNGSGCCSTRRFTFTPMH